MSVSTREVQTDWSQRSRRSFCKNISNSRDFAPDLPNHTRSQSTIRRPQSPTRNRQSTIRNPQSPIRNPQSAIWSGKRGSNPRPSAWEADALPTELFPPASRNRRFPPVQVSFVPNPAACQGFCSRRAMRTSAMRCPSSRSTVKTALSVSNFSPASGIRPRCISRKPASVSY